MPTVPLWYKQQMIFLNPKFNQIRPKNDTFQSFIRLKKLPKSFGIVQLTESTVLQHVDTVNSP